MWPDYDQDPVRIAYHYDISPCQNNCNFHLDGQPSDMYIPKGSGTTYEYPVNLSHVKCLRPDGVTRTYNNWYKWALDRGVRIATKDELVNHFAM